jgi:quercetin dioxygenase-like cupin family protein
MPLERAYRVAPDEDLGGWFESDGEMTVYVIDGEIELTRLGPN